MFDDNKKKDNICPSPISQRCLSRGTKMSMNEIFCSCGESSSAHIYHQYVYELKKLKESVLIPKLVEMLEYFDFFSDDSSKVAISRSLMLKHATLVYNITSAVVERNKRDGIINEDTLVIMESNEYGFPIVYLSSGGVKMVVESLRKESCYIEYITDDSLFYAFLFRQSRFYNFFSENKKIRKSQLKSYISAIDETNEQIAKIKTETNEEKKVSYNLPLNGVFERQWNEIDEASLGILGISVMPSGAVGTAQQVQNRFSRTTTYLNGGPEESHRISLDFIQERMDILDPLIDYEPRHSRREKDSVFFTHELINTNQGKEYNSVVADIYLPNGYIFLGPLLLSSKTSCLNLQVLREAASFIRKRPNINILLDAPRRSDTTDKITRYSFVEGCGLQNLSEELDYQVVCLVSR